jgi:hypothetical protein
MNERLKILKSIAREVLILASIAAICYGVYQIYPAMAWIVGGLIMSWVTIPGRKVAK